MPSAISTPIGLTILATVISKPGPNRAVIDTGLKSLTTDSGFAEPKNLPNINLRARPATNTVH